MTQKTTEPYFKKYFDMQKDWNFETSDRNKFDYMIEQIDKIRKFKSLNHVSQTTYVELVLPMEELLMMSDFLVDFIASQGIYKLSTGDYLIKISEWQNGPN